MITLRGGTGGVLGTTDGTTTGNKATLALWNAAVPADLNSVSQNPNYLAGLKIDTTIPTQLESGGATGTGITTDFEGETDSHHQISVQMNLQAYFWIYQHPQ